LLRIKFYGPVGCWCNSRPTSAIFHWISFICFRKQRAEDEWLGIISAKQSTK